MSWHEEVKQALKLGGVPAQYVDLALPVIIDQCLIARQQGFNQALEEGGDFRYKRLLDRLIDELDPDMGIYVIRRLRESLIRERAELWA